MDPDPSANESADTPPFTPEQLNWIDQLITSRQNQSRPSTDSKLPIFIGLSCPQTNFKHCYINNVSCLALMPAPAHFFIACSLWDSLIPRPGDEATFGIVTKRSQAEVRNEAKGSAICRCGVMKHKSHQFQ